MEKHLFVVLSQTGTFPSRLIKLFTHAQYNHASLALTPDLKEMYSFGRVSTYQPLRGGFVKESPDYGTFFRFYRAGIAVVRFAVSQQQYEGVRVRLQTMYERRKQYKYSYKGLLYAIKKRAYRRENYFFCSEFVVRVLAEAGVVEEELAARFVAPQDLLTVQGGEVVYRGQMCDFATRPRKKTRGARKRAVCRPQLARAEE